MIIHTYIIHMPNHSEVLQFFLNLNKVHTIVSRRLDAGLNGISFNELIILYHLRYAEKLRRTDLAAKVGLTQSAITRLLLPMEKIGLVKKENDENDARASYVSLAAGGRRKLEEGLERLAIFATDIGVGTNPGRLKNTNDFLDDLKRNID